MHWPLLHMHLTCRCLAGLNSGRALDATSALVPPSLARNGLAGKRETRRMYAGLYLGMFFLYVRNIFR